MLRVLCLDIEGGYGGSSRSLFESLRHMDRSAVAPEVWCRRAGPIQARYEAIGIPCRVTPAMPKVTAVPRLSRNLVLGALAAVDFHRSRAFRRDLAGAPFDLIHLNHEALYRLAAWLRRNSGIPQTVHVRTRVSDNAFGRRQVRIVSEAADAVVFITENEQAHFAALGGAPRRSRVIYNIADPVEAEPSPSVPKDDRLKVASIGNYAWVRGIDRVVDVAAALAARERRDVLFVMAGDMGLPRSLPGLLGEVARAGGTLADYAQRRGVADMFLFLGHVPDPERVMAACDLLIKPTREANPWGRDIIEGLAAGRPVLSVGTFERFVESGVTGYLQPAFDPDGMADEILGLAADPGRRSSMGQAARERIRALCGGPARAADLFAVWRQAARA